LPGDATELDFNVPMEIVDDQVPVMYDGLAPPDVRVSGVHFSGAIPCGGAIAGERTDFELERTKVGYYGEHFGPSPTREWAGIALRIETRAGPRYVRIGAPPVDGTVGVPPSVFRFDLTPEHLATIATLPPDVLGC